MHDMLICKTVPFPFFGHLALLAFNGDRLPVDAWNGYYETESAMAA